MPPKMSLRKTIKDIESNFEVEKVQINKFGKNFQVYPWIKSRLLSFYVAGDSLLLQTNKQLYIQQFKSLFYGWWNIYRKYDTWVFSSSVERKLINGEYFDKLFDYYATETGRKTLIIESRHPKGFKRKQVASKYVISKSIFFFLELVYKKLFLRKVNVENEEILEQLKNHLDIDIDLNHSIKKNLAQYKVMKFWLKLFPNPKEVLLSVGYTNFGYIQAFKERNIPVYEFQHGLINDNHQGYNYFKKFDSSNFPDAIATFGEDEVEALTTNNELNLTKGAFPVGSFILQNKLENAANVISLENGEKAIAVTLQDGEIGDELVRQLNDFEMEGFVFYLKPRKATPDYYTNLLELKPHLRIITDVDTYDLIRSCHAHLTVYSTCATESVVLGRPNFFFDVEGYSSKHFKNSLPASKFVTYVTSVVELQDSLSSFDFEYDEHEISRKFSNKIAAGYFDNIQRFADSLKS